jgi:putative acetyltransferase
MGAVKMAEIDIRESVTGEVEAILSLYPAAFPEEDLVPLVRRLLSEPPGVLSLVAFADGVLAGQGCFTPCGIGGACDTAALLGPLAVAPARQGMGIGSALVRCGLVRMKQAGVALVCVLGDPAYYGRFGFRPETNVAPPYPLPEEWRDAWQSARLEAGPSLPTGALAVPSPWRDPALWAP